MPAGESVLGAASGRQVAAALVRFARQHASTFAATIVVTCLAAVAGAATPWLVGAIIDELRRGGRVSRVDVLGLATVAVAVAHLLLTRWALALGMRLGERMQASMRDDLFERVLSMPAAVVERVGPGDLIARGTGDIALAGATLRDAAPAVAVSVLEIVFVVAALVLVDPVLGLAGMLGLSGIVVAARWYLRRGAPAYLEQGAGMSALAEQLAATVAGARTVDAFRLEDLRAAACEDAIAMARRAQLRTLFLRSVLYPSVDVSVVLPLVVVMLLGATRVADRDLTLGTVVASLLYLQRLARPVAAILERIEQLQGSLASVARVEGLAELAVAPTPTSTAMEVDASGLEAAGVHYAYHGDHDVLVDVSLCIEPGERVAIVGASGAGKSTLGRLFVGADGPRRGSVTVGGVAVASIPAEKRRTQVLLVTQEQHVFLGTLRDNLALAAPDASDDELTRALASVGASWLEQLADGLDTPVGAFGARLDPGQVQQLALARVVLADPHTVVLDEATSMVDPRTAERTERALAEVLAGRSIVTIAHRLHAARAADRVAVMEAGRLVELGTHADLMARRGAYWTLWASWTGEVGPGAGG